MRYHLFNLFLIAVFTTIIWGCQPVPQPPIDEGPPDYLPELEKLGLVPTYEQAHWIMYVFNRDLMFFDSTHHSVSYLNLPVELMHYHISNNTIDFRFDIPHKSLEYQDTAAFIYWGLGFCKNCEEPYHFIGGPINYDMSLIMDNDSSNLNLNLKKEEAEMLSAIAYRHLTNQPINPWLLQQAKARYRNNGFLKWQRL